MAYPAKYSLPTRPKKIRKTAPLAAAATLAAAALALTGVPLAQAAPTLPPLPEQSGLNVQKRQVEALDRAPVAVLTDQGVTHLTGLAPLEVGALDSAGLHLWAALLNVVMPQDDYRDWVNRQRGTR